jgi:hypothetical protein
MTFKKVFLILLFPILADLVVSCCNCLGTVIHHYTNKTIVVSNLDNSGQAPQVTSSGSVFKSAYGIRVKLIREKTARIDKPRIVFGECAYARECFCQPPDQFLPNDSITAIRIITLNDFNSDHLASSDVSGYFKVYVPYSFSTTDDYVKNTSASFNYDTDLQINIDLLLMTPPDSVGACQFRVQIVLSDGRTLEQDTPTIDFI